MGGHETGGGWSKTGPVATPLPWLGPKTATDNRRATLYRYMCVEYIVDRKIINFIRRKNSIVSQTNKNKQKKTKEKKH